MVLTYQKQKRYKVNTDVRSIELVLCEILLREIPVTRKQQTEFHPLRVM